MVFCTPKGDLRVSPDIFVQLLTEAAPSLDALERRGLSNEEAREFRKYYLCMKRDQPLPEPSGSDPVLRLLRDWDLRNLEIGMVRFPGPCVEISAGTCIGCVEADPLIRLLEGGEIVVHELGTKEHVLWRVAKNGSALLDALSIAARFLAKGATATIDIDECEAARVAAAACANAAGGDEYIDFYTMLLGAN